MHKAVADLEGAQQEPPPLQKKKKFDWLCF